MVLGKRRTLVVLGNTRTGLPNLDLPNTYQENDVEIKAFEKKHYTPEAPPTSFAMTPKQPISLTGRHYKWVGRVLLLRAYEMSLSHKIWKLSMRLSE